MRTALTTILVLAGLILFTGFEKKPVKSQAELMEEYIEGEMVQKRREEWKKCMTNTVKDAERYVDSIIYRRVNFNIGDSLKTPGKPAKPTRPFDTLKLDTTPIKPILKGKEIVN
jgi:hypothetical protein